jgi:hypothetical protein
MATRLEIMAAIPEKMMILEIDEDGEIAGRRSVESTSTVIPIASPPKSLAWFRLELSENLHHIEEAQVGWFDYEEYPDYTLTNDSLWYLSVHIAIQNTTEKQYDQAWDIFRKRGIPKLMDSLHLSSWGMGRGIVDRRGQALFAIELDGFGCPEWELYMSIKTNDSYSSLREKVAIIDNVCVQHIKSWIKA